MLLVVGNFAKAQYRGPREYPYGGVRPNYSVADEQRIAHEITALSKARSRGEGVHPNVLPWPAQEYAEVYDGRYHEQNQELVPPRGDYAAEPEPLIADDQRW
jgi:hypothetical protein